MDQYEVIEQEIKDKQQQLEQAKEIYHDSCKIIEKKYDEMCSRQNQLFQLLETKHNLFKHVLDEEKGDTTRLTNQLNVIASDFSEQFSMAYRKQQQQLEQDYSQIEENYKKELCNLEEELVQLEYQRHQIDLEKGGR